MKSKNINCPNCGAILGNGRYCQYCGTDTGRTEHIDLYVNTKNIPTKTFNIGIEIDELTLKMFDATMSVAEKEEQIKRMLFDKFVSETFDHCIDSITLKESGVFTDDPLNNRTRFEIQGVIGFY